jgi:hypothetical protein
MSLKPRLILRCALSVAACTALLFLPAGTFRFWQAWVFMGLLFLPMFISSAYFYKHDPDLTERRLQTRERVGRQKIIMGLASVLGTCCFILPGLDYRFGWSRRALGPEPLWFMICADVLFLAAYLLTYWVMLVNSYASRTIQVAAGQKVIRPVPTA